eukprot:gb/GFBE01042349.1/.p1 GENE.gb/GFBE01042349.1/~~gb/GFBE01042349.1/.p1  ORF type:complete len:542 (+),score=97.70 gb/GFBE01042349.1/:1-1626(+)
MWRICALLVAASLVAGFNPCANVGDYKPQASISSSYLCEDIVNLITSNGVSAESCDEMSNGGKPWKYYVQLAGISCCAGKPGDMCGLPFLPCAEPANYDMAATTSSLGSCATAVGLLTELGTSSEHCHDDFQGSGTPTSYFVQDVGMSCCREGKGSYVCGAPYNTCKNEEDFTPDVQPSSGTSCKSIVGMLRMAGFPTKIGCADNVLDVPVKTYISMVEMGCCGDGKINHACGVPWNPCKNAVDFTPNANAYIDGMSVGSCSGLVSTLNFYKFSSDKCDDDLANGVTFKTYAEAVETSCCGTGDRIYECGEPYNPCVTPTDFMPDVEVAPGTSCQAVMNSMHTAGFQQSMCNDIFAGNAPYATYIKMAERVCCGSAWGGKGTCGTSLNPCKNPNNFVGTAQIMGTQCGSAMAQMFDVPDIFAVDCTTCLSPVMAGRTITLKQMLPSGQSCCGGNAYVDVCDQCGTTVVTTTTTSTSTSTSGTTEVATTTEADTNTSSTTIGANTTTTTTTTLRKRGAAAHLAVSPLAVLSAVAAFLVSASL